MPFTPADATKYDKAAITPAKKRMWASIANAVLTKHGDDGMAIRVANSKVEDVLVREPLLVEGNFLMRVAKASYPRQEEPEKPKIKKADPKKPLFKERVKKFLKKMSRKARQWSDPEFGR